ncbi:MAG TPA: metal ABC transporter permease [Kofleriaceae bacterium]|nr:metal ABC transporter permease [Kofleriaceae bacterium]
MRYPHARDLADRVRHAAGVPGPRLSSSASRDRGLRYLGVLRMGSLVIVPAATAKRLARTLPQMLAHAVVIAVLATVAGTVVARHVGYPPGPVIISIAALCFLASLIRRRG